ncbi:hypothetical protein DUNSADRAFT_9199, partial [Dunaliella salina]
DANCDQRLYNDRYSTICRVSRKLFPPFESDAAAMCVDQATRWADQLTFCVRVFGSVRTKATRSGSLS